MGFQDTIHQIIKEYPEADYEKALVGNTDFDVFYHLTDLRTALFSWVDFPQGCSLLEIGAGFGALTGYFAKKCTRVVATEKNTKRWEALQLRMQTHPNVEVLHVDIAEWACEEKFDFIIVGGAFERQDHPVAYLQMLKSWLKPDGRLFLVVENKKGAHLRCGATPEAFKEKRFLSLNDRGRLHYDRENLGDTIRAAAFAHYKFYYPMPSASFAQVVYSEDTLPGEDALDRLRFLYRPGDKEQGVEEEKKFLQAAIRNGNFPQMANSFLVECTVGAEVSSLQYATMTLDRKPDCCLVTKIFPDCVWKQAIYSEGEPSLVAAAKNLLRLQERGVPVISMEQGTNASGQTIWKMSREHAPLLSIALERVSKGKAEELYRIFDRLYEDICRSSEVVEAEQNALLTRCTEAEKMLPWGPVLKHCYIEMIPLNCFYREGELVYFDQEFVYENYPASYVIFRALRNSYAFQKGLERIVPLSKMVEHFGLTGLWKFYEAVDEEFLERVRKETDPYVVFSASKKYSIGYIPGTFDLFHIGHLNLLRQAKAMCDYLIVGVCTDDLIQLYKGHGPVIPFAERCAVVESVRYVDEVIGVDEYLSDKIHAWEKLHYHAHFCGDDHLEHWQSERAYLKERGTDFVFFPYTKEQSSTAIRNCLGDQNNGEKKAKDAKTEARTGFVVTEKTKKIWQVELNILAEIEKLCERHQLRYFALHGTLLGAVRHGGFIPWDDDLDIGMLRRDYDIFLQKAKEELPEWLFVQSMYSDPEAFRNGLIRVRDSRTTGIEEAVLHRECNKGIWVDILPIDASPKEDAAFREKSKQVSYYNRLLQAKVNGADGNRDLREKSPLQCYRYRLEAKLFSYAQLCRKLDEAMKEGSYAETDSEKWELGIFTGAGPYWQLNEADFGQTVELPFADRTIKAPVGYQNYLFMVMGSDYMKLPPENEQRPKHRGIFDPDRPYPEYEKLFCGMLQGSEGKKIILFGAGMMMDDYMKKFGRRYKPAFVVDNDTNKWGRTRQGIEIRNPQDIVTIPAEKRHVIICSAYYPAIEKQLQEMGITYHIYIQNIAWITDTENQAQHRF